MRNVIIMGAAGRDFHNFNVVYRERDDIRVVAFTTAQAPFTGSRTYPTQLAGRHYPDGIPIRDEIELPFLISELAVDEVVFASSDVSHLDVMHTASQTLAAGASFTLLGPRETMIPAPMPVVSVTAVRTGAGKSQTVRAVTRVLREAGLTPVVVRHPMPYGDVHAERVQRFGSIADLDAARVTIEEREEFEPHLLAGTVVYAGVDYRSILSEARSECDVLVWDGGNNDFSFYVPDLSIVVTDPLRIGHETTFHPGEANLRMADAVMVNKIDSASMAQVETLVDSIEAINPDAVVITARSPVFASDPAAIFNRRVLVIEDGPTLTHGGTRFGAGVVAARAHGASAIVDPRPWATGSLAGVYERYPVGGVLPAMGYSPEQLSDLERVVNAAECDVVIVATPIDLRHLIRIDKPAVRVTYELEEVGDPTLSTVLEPIIEQARAVIAGGA